MPIEIRELIISAKVPKKGRGLLKGAAGSRKNRASSEETVAAAVDSVMRIMKKKKER
jgi:hypothetical protein